MVTMMVPEPAAPVSSASDSENWIVCRGVTRDVVDGTVVCPARGSIDVAVCQECRFLETVSGEWRRWSCGAGER